MTAPSKSATFAADVKGIIFDLDGTLYTARFLGLTITGGLLRDLMLLKYLFRARKLERGNEYPDRETLEAGFTKTFSQLAGISPERARDWYENRFMPCFTRAIKKRGKQRTGLPDILSRLKAAGIKLGVVSDFEHVAPRLEAIGLSPALFDIAVGAAAYGVMKPSAKPFTVIADQWEIPIENILLLGDREDFDQKSAKLAGAQFLGVTGSRQAGVDFLSWGEARALLGLLVS